MPIIHNISDHDFHLPIFPDLTRKDGEDLDAFQRRVQATMPMQEGEDPDAYDRRMASSAILTPKSRKEKGNEGEDGYEPGGPGELEVTAEQLAFMKKHRVARRWFGVDVKKGQGLVVAEAPEGEKKKGKAA